MLWNYIKIGYRSILKNRLPSIINTIGLGIAFGCLLVLFTFLDKIHNFDDCHENADRIYLVESVIEQDGQNRIYGSTPFALGPSIQADFPEVEEVTRMQYSSADFRYEDRVFNERVIFVDEGFLDIFSYPILKGSRNSLKQKNQIILSRNIAIKYFGKDEAVGKQVSMLFSMKGKEYKENFIIGAVAEKIPYSASLGFDILIPFENRKNLGLDENGDWKNFTNATFVMMNEPGQTGNISGRINNYTNHQNLSNPDKKIVEFLFDPLPDMSLNAYGKEAMITYGAHPTARVVLTVIAIFILILAVFNYINIAVVSATSRLKEIGLRKSIGGTRKQIILQFISENAILCLISLAFGWVLASGLLLQGFNTIVNSNHPLVFEYNNPRFWIFITSVFFVVAFGSAAYPAFFISGFKPVNIFKGNLKITSRNYFTKSMLAVQFIISFITISLGVVFVMNEDYIKDRDWGYDKEQTIVIPLAYSDQYPELRDEFTQNSYIDVITGSQNHLGYWTDEDLVGFNNEQYSSRRLMAGYEYLDAMGIRLKKGRFFEPQSSTDRSESLVVNEAFLDKLGIGDPIGARIIVDSTAHYIIGVVDDFHYMHFGHEIKPIFFKIADEYSFNNIIFRTLPGEAENAEKFAESTWKKLYPDNTYEGYFQNAAFDQYYRENEGISSLMIAIACIAILISCMGLFGLVSLFINKKLKEFSIRKVMGASVKEITLLVNKGFMWVIIISSILGIPIAFFLSKAVIESIYTYHTPLNTIPYAITAFILIFTALATVSSQILKAIKVNPAEQLRNE
jgi:ABC-type antimicrobial peptide transport system permease subunit